MTSNLLKLYRQSKNYAGNLLCIYNSKNKWIVVLCEFYASFSSFKKQKRRKMLEVNKKEGILEQRYYGLATSFYVKQGINQLPDLLRFYVTVF